MNVHELAIIGAGPIGIELAVGLRRAGRSYVHLEAGSIGSTIHWYAPGTPFFSSPERIAIAGVPIVTSTQGKPTREEYLMYLRGVVQQFDLPIWAGTRVTKIERIPYGGFMLHLRRSVHGVGGPREWASRECGTVVPAMRSPTAGMLATATPAGRPDHGGMLGPIQVHELVLAFGNLHLPRTLGIPGEDLPHVSHWFDDPHLYFGRRVLIVGGKNSAVEAAIRLVRVGCDVTLSYRGEWFNAKSVKYWLLPELEFFIKKGRVTFLPRTVPVEITPGGVRLAPVDQNGGTISGDDAGGATGGGGVQVQADFVLLLTGYVQDQSLFEQAGVKLEGERRIPKYDPRTMETNVRGVFVAGTAAAGIHDGRALEFIETAHVHVDRIVAALTGQPPPVEAPPREPAFLES